MRRHIVLWSLTATNLVLLLGIGLSQVVPAAAESGPGTVRGSAFELVDAQGRVRASLSLQPAGGGASETVLLRLIQADGQPAVKIAASATGAGLSFVGGDDESYVLLEADGPEARLETMEQSGRERRAWP